MVTDSLQGFILFWIFTFNKRVFDLYNQAWRRLRASREARQEEKERLRLRAAMMRQQSECLNVLGIVAPQYKQYPHPHSPRSPVGGWQVGQVEELLGVQAGEESQEGVRSQ